MTSKEPSVTYEWDAPSTEPLAQVDGYTGRTTTIEPRTVKIHAGGSYRKPGEVYVYIEGRTIRRDGEYGSTNRAVVYGDDPSHETQNLENAPDWLLPLVEQARQWELRRRKPNQKTE